MKKGEIFTSIKLVSILVLIVISEGLNAQISIQGTPESFYVTTKSRSIIPSNTLDSIYVDKYLEEDSKNGIPNRYGIVRSLNINIQEEGVKTQSNNMNIWRYKIKCPDAVSIGINFANYELPEEASVYVYNSDASIISGAFTSQNNKDNSMLMIGNIASNEIIIEYDIPVNSEWQGNLVIGSVSLAYKSLKSTTDNSSWVQINCTEGEDWQTQKRAVCLMSFNDSQYSYYCSGALINNVREDKTPYFLTANHCISTESEAETLVTYFNYENSECDNSDASLSQSLSGATLIAANSASDFTLLELSEYPPDSYKPFLAGWNASDDNPETGTCIHHPEGKYKCIAIDNDAPQSYDKRVMWDNNRITEANTHWEVEYDTGTDESGSSGSPLFNEDKQIIGQLHGGDDEISLFGKLSVSWDNSSTTTKQLKHWLDPDDTGTEKIDGLDYLSIPTAKFEADVSLSCLNSTVYFSDESEQDPTNWLWIFSPNTVEFVNGTDSSSQNPEVEFLKEGLYSVSMIAGNKYGKDTAISENLIDAVSQLDVELDKTEKEITLCGCDFDDYTLIASGANKYNFWVADSNKFDLYTSSDTLQMTLKDTVRKYGSFDTYVKVTGSHGSCVGTDSILFHIKMPTNDDAQNAVSLKLGRNSSYTNRCGTVEDDEPDGMSATNTVWFSFLGPSSGETDIVISGAPVMQALYQADSYSELLNGDYELISYNKSTTSENENSEINVDPGKTYWLQVGAVNSEYGDLSINILSNSLEVYPNPSTGKFYLTISNKEEGTAEIGIYSVDGRQVLHKSIDTDLDNNEVELNLSNQAQGVYFFRAIINGVTLTKKLILK